MSINKSKRIDYRHTLKFDTIEALHEAILVFGGAAPHSRDETKRQIGESSGRPGSVLAAIALPWGGGSFARKLVNDIGDLSSEQVYCQSWGHDGPGPFRKATVTVRKKADKIFFLSIDTGSLYNEPEIRLSEKIQAPIGFCHTEMERTYKARGDRFEIPLGDIKSAYTALGQPFEETAFLQALTTQGTDTLRPISQVSVVKENKFGVKIGLTPGSTPTIHCYENNPGRDYRYRIENGNLTGPALLNARTGKTRAAGLYLYFSPNEYPTYDRQLEQRIVHLADAVEAAWKGSPAAIGPRPSSAGFLNGIRTIE